MQIWRNEGEENSFIEENKNLKGAVINKEEAGSLNSSGFLLAEWQYSLIGRTVVGQRENLPFSCWTSKAITFFLLATQGTSLPVWGLQIAMSGGHESFHLQRPDSNLSEVSFIHVHINHSY